MNQLFLNEILRVGGDPADEIWIWLVTRGPHGRDFTWGQTRREPAGFVGVNLLERVADEMATTVPKFKERARLILRMAFHSELPELVRRAIQVAAVVGGNVELELIRSFITSSIPEIAADAKACSFYLKRRI